MAALFGNGAVDAGDGAERAAASRAERARRDARAAHRRVADTG